MKRLLLCVGILTLGLPLCAQFRPIKTPFLRPNKGPLREQLSKLTDEQLHSLVNKLRTENAALQREITAQRELKNNLFTNTRAAVFRVLPPVKQSINTFSGTAFKTTYNGQEEIFGLIPMHVLRTDEHVVGTLSYKFTAGINTPSGVKNIPAWVVQLSSTKTGDLALVKFRKEDEPLLTPLTLEEKELEFPAQVYAQGFARHILTNQSFQLLGKTSAGILTAQLPAAYQGERAGFCGSPVMTPNATLAGVHVGSTYLQGDQDAERFFNAFKLNAPQVENADVGFVTPVSFIKQLVQAYHEPKTKPIPVTLAGQEITRLAINEYVSRIELMDKDMRVVWKKEMDYKVSFSAAETVLRLRPDIAYIGVSIGRTGWAKDDGKWVVKNTPQTSSVLYKINR